jgi:hypothetical protein
MSPACPARKAAPASQVRKKAYRGWVAQKSCSRGAVSTISSSLFESRACPCGSNTQFGCDHASSVVALVSVAGCAGPPRG